MRKVLAAQEAQTMKSWLVRYRRSCEGEAVVEAKTAADAKAFIETGGFGYDPTEEMFDWEAIGEPEENK